MKFVKRESALIPDAPFQSFTFIRAATAPEHAVGVRFQIDQQQHVELGGIFVLSEVGHEFFIRRELILLELGELEWSQTDLLLGNQDLATLPKFEKRPPRFQTA